MRADRRNRATTRAGRWLLGVALMLGCGGEANDPPRSVRVAPPTALAASLEEVRDSLQALADRGLAVSVAVAREDGLLWSEALGYADPVERRPATAETRYRIYSLAKPMTAMAAARLMEHGRLDPEAPVQRYVPAFPEKRATITPMHLATHTSGIRHYNGPEEARGRRHCESVEDALPFFSRDSLLHSPGERETYSSWGYVLLSAVVEEAAGLPFTEAMQNWVFGPAGMTGTVLDDPGTPGPNRANFYREAPEGTVELEEPVDNTCKWGAGGFLSTAEDVARFALTMVHGDLVSRPTRQLFLRGSSTYTAQGVGAGGTAFLVADAERRLGIALLSNVTGETLGPALQRLARRIHEAVRVDPDAITEAGG